MSVFCLAAFSAAGEAMKGHEFGDLRREIGDSGTAA